MNNIHLNKISNIKRELKQLGDKGLEGSIAYCIGSTILDMISMSEYSGSDGDKFQFNNSYKAFMKLCNSMKEK